MIRRGGLAAAALAVVLATAGCGSADPGITAAASASLQREVRAVARLAAGHHYAAARRSLAALQADLERSVSTGAVSAPRAARIRAAARLVAADLAAAVPAAPTRTPTPTRTAPPASARATPRPTAAPEAPKAPKPAKHPGKGKWKGNGKGKGDEGDEGQDD